MKKLLLLGLVAMSIPLMAENRIFYLQLPCWDVDLSGGVDALYWAGCGQNFPYALYINQPNLNLIFADTTYRNLAPNYGWGVRMWAGLRDRCSGRRAELEWLHFNQTTSTTARENPSLGRLVVVSYVDDFKLATATSVLGRQRNRYDAINLRFFQSFCSNCFGEFSAYLGGGWREIFVKEEIIPTGSILTYESNTLDFNGGAILVGLDATSWLGGGIGCNARFGGIIGIGGLSFKNRSEGFVVVNGVLNKQEPRRTRCVPGLEFLASIDYAVQCDCYTVKGEIGYRAEYYFNLSSVDTFIEEDAPSDQESRGFGGPFIGVSVTF